MIVPTPLFETAQKTSKVSFTWAKLIARIYEVDPLLCGCGKEMKIIKIVTNPTEIWCILKKIGWPTTAPDFEGLQELIEWDIYQLLPGTADGFPEECYLLSEAADGFPEKYYPHFNSGPELLIANPKIISILRIGKIQISLNMTKGNHRKSDEIKPGVFISLN